MKLWTNLKKIIAPKRQAKSNEIVAQLAEPLPCFICATSLDPKEHRCSNPKPPSDVFTRYIACHKALKRLVVAIETDSLTNEDIDKAKSALRLT